MSTQIDRELTAGLSLLIQFPAGPQAAAEEDVERGFVVFGYGEYGRDSVLAGQARRVRLGSFDTLKEARTAYPTAGISDDAADAHVAMVSAGAARTTGGQQ